MDPRDASASKNMAIFNGICHEEGGGLMCHYVYFFKMSFFVKKKTKKHLESFLDCLHIVWALHYIHIAVEVTMNMAAYTSCSCKFRTNNNRT